MVSLVNISKYKNTFQFPVRLLKPASQKHNTIKHEKYLLIKANVNI